MAGDEPHGPAHLPGQRLKAGAVRAQGGVVVGRHWQLDVAQHVAAEDHRRSVEHQRDMARGVRIVLDDPRLGSGPRQRRTGQGAEPSGHRQQIGGEELGGRCEDRVPVRSKAVRRPIAGPARGFTEARVPQDVIVVLVSGDPRNTSDPEGGKVRRDGRELVGVPGGVDHDGAPGTIEEHGGERRVLPARATHTPGSNWTSRPRAPTHGRLLAHGPPDGQRRPDDRRAPAGAHIAHCDAARDSASRAEAQQSGMAIKAALADQFALTNVTLELEDIPGDSRMPDVTVVDPAGSRPSLTSG